MSKRYFSELSQALHHAHVAMPCLVIDKDRLDHNLAELSKTLSQGFNYRIVAKSLPSLPLLSYIMQQTGSQRFMSFHLPFLIELITHIPTADVLLGKPMPVAAARSFYQHQRLHPNQFDPSRQLQWLIDSPARLSQYQALAEELEVDLQLCLEVDIGLHRGGFQRDPLFQQCLEQISQHPRLRLTGLMGYEAHISKLPRLLGGTQLAFNAARARYQQFVQLISRTLGAEILDGLCLNTGGSSTYALYKNTNLTVATELSVASALVKPTDFDVKTLARHQPAVFIATPVLKTTTAISIPDAPKLSAWLQKLHLLPRQGCFIYGGYWQAKPCYPQAAKPHSLFGRSSNQEFYQLKANSELKVDDYFFFRPSQSEAVLLQFGRIAVYQQGRIIDWWPVFNYPSELPNYQL